MVRRILSVAGVVIAIALAAPAVARPPPGGGEKNGVGHRTHAVPEFDPSAVGAVAALVAAGGLLLARRRR